eukprot:3965565-Ditylum_brightwellii.AAC.1
MLLHAKKYWPEYITTMLWPYVLKATKVNFNKYDVDDKGALPKEKFANIWTVQNLMDEHTWGCQVYILDAHL